MSSDSDLQKRLNVEVPHSARIWNYLLGGKDNFEADRVAADAVLDQMPEIRTLPGEVTELSYWGLPLRGCETPTPQ
jgi:hypothetical protein